MLTQPGGWEEDEKIFDQVSRKLFCLQFHDPPASVRDQPLPPADQETQRPADLRPPAGSAGGGATLC